MSTAVATIPQNLPAFLQRQDLLADAQKFNAAALGGIKTGGFPRISIAGSKFFIIDSAADNPRQLITATDPSGAVLPAMMLSAVVVGANPGISKTYYEGDFQPGSEEEPDCSSDDGVTPDSHIANPPSQACATCPKNMWGSKIWQGKELKACSDSKRLVILPAADLKFKALGLSISPASLKEWGAYARQLDARGLPVFAVVTRITFDHTVTFPKLNFSFERLVSEEEFAIIQQRMASDEVKNIERPQRAPRRPALPAPGQVPVNVPVVQAPAPQIAQAGFAPPVTQEVATAVQQQVSAQPDPVMAAAQQVAFGVAPAAVAQPQPAAGDPFAGLPPETVAAINAVGGKDTPIGKQIYDAAKAVLNTNVAAPAPLPVIDNAAQAAAQAVLANPPTPGRGRGRPRKNPEAAPAAPAQPTQPAQPVATTGSGQAPAPAAQPVQQEAPQPAPEQQPAPAAQPGFASSPAAVVVQPSGGLGSELDALLNNVMGALNA